MEHWSLWSLICVHNGYLLVETHSLISADIQAHQWLIDHVSNDCTSVLALKERKEVANRLKDLFNAPTYDQAVERRDQLVKDWQTEFPKVVKKLENSFDELMVIYQLP